MTMDPSTLHTLDGTMEYVRRGIFRAAREIMETDGVHYPLAFVLATTFRGRKLAHPEAVAIPFGNGAFDDAGKDMFSGVLREAAKETEAVAVIVVTEAWSSSLVADPSGPLLVPRPSEDPNRREILNITVEHADGFVCCDAPIIRDGDAVRLGDFTEDRDRGVSYGRFVNLLGKPRPPEAEA
jgi:hypothetical protein